MNKTFLNCIFSLSLLTCTGCTSTFISDSLAIIEREENRENSQVVNTKVLMSIQALRAAQKMAQHIHITTYTFTYELHDKELNYRNRIKLAKILVQNKHPIIINIAPAKGESQLQQLSLAMKRATILRQYVERLNKGVTIIFAPDLSTDTIHLSIGA
ncbi:hypothetical protein CMT41_06550 [Colwellia sp. MT41]|uniref:hypothetical protein n=1 Tax=Colwellia sp. MT41 TaxID=58049 RepID=UPI000717745B|nr:hypothetical protein [Colwellia sp. MT41]ALO34417.1 hypothetical protein CMT41_06550 [Colwellia sp. MT41]